jgi:gamma-glutamylcyclotransferase (GGCT)/AIG2-like uncharacterized protein YtfP
MMNSKNQTLVAVYGTLRNQNLGPVIQLNDTINGLAVSLGSYPALVSLDTDRKLKVDVISVSDEQLAALDNYEGYPHLYGKATTTTEAGHTVIVYVYNKLLFDWNTQTTSPNPEITL